MTVTLGADPEVFISDRRTGGVVPAIGLIGGTKDSPIQAKGLSDGYMLQEDNVMAEFNIPPCTSPRTFARSIRAGLDAVQAALNGHLDEDGSAIYKVDEEPSRLFGAHMLRSEQARQFGCSADNNAYLRGRIFQRVKPRSLYIQDGEAAWRFCGGHLHLGFGDGKPPLPPHVLAQFCDVYIGLRSLHWDKQGKRRAVYGQAGRFRPKPYGIEYRTLSNRWLFNGMAGEVAEEATALARTATRHPSLLRKAYEQVPWMDVKDVINEENEVRANDLLQYIKDELGLLII